MSIGFWKFKHLHLLPQEDLLQNHFPLHKKQAGLTQNHSSYCMGILSENCLIQLFQKKSPQIRAPILLLSCSKISSLLGIQGVKTSPYHPQTDGLVEIFSKTLKSMVRKVVNETQADWDQQLQFLLFAYREFPQISTGFLLFQLLYGHPVRGLMDVLKEAWQGSLSEQRFCELSCSQSERQTANRNLLIIIWLMLNNS